MRPLVLVALVSACAGAQPEPAASPPVSIPTQPERDAAPVATAAKDAGAAEAKRVEHPLPAGANGPRDAAGMIGDAGKVVRGTPEATVLFNSAELRTHPFGPALARAILGTLSGWNIFMPWDVVHPLRETDWVLIAGSLRMGGTAKNVFIARYNFDEKKADAAAAALVKRLPKGKAAGKGLTATVDGAERAYVRPKAGVVAIVPKDDAKSTTDAIARAEVPSHVRKNELVRGAFPKAPSFAASVLPQDVGAMRLWVDASGDALTLNAEGDCASPEAAARAADELSATLLRYASGLVGNMLRSVLREARVWADGSTVRYQADLDESVVELAATFGCSDCGVPP